MSGSGDLQPNSGLRYHTDADSPLPETINPIIDVVETNSANISLIDSLLQRAKVEYVWIGAAEQYRVNVPTSTSVFVLMSVNSSETASMALYTRFSDPEAGHVQTIFKESASMSFTTNATRTAFFIKPTYPARGIIITVSSGTAGE